MLTGGIDATAAFRDSLTTQSLLNSHRCHLTRHRYRPRAFFTSPDTAQRKTTPYHHSSLVTLCRLRPDTNNTLQENAERWKTFPFPLLILWDCVYPDSDGWGGGRKWLCEITDYEWAVYVGGECNAKMDGSIKEGYFLSNICFFFHPFG